MDDIPDGTVVWLYRTEGDMGIGIANDTLRNGQFSITASTRGDSVECMALSAYGGEGFPLQTLDLYVMNGCHIAVEGKDKVTATWKVTSNIPQQQTQQKLIGAVKELYKLETSARLELDSCESLYFKGKTTAVQKKELAPRIQSLREQIERYSVQMDSIHIPLMQQLPVDEAWMEQLKLLSYSVKNIDEYPYKIEVLNLYNGLQEVWKQSTLGQDIQTALLPPDPVEDGDRLPEARLTDIDGHPRNLSSFAGKYLLLDFWSSACQPCVEALPELKEVAGTYADRLTVVSISVDPEELWKRASGKHALPGVNLNDPKGMNGLAARFIRLGIPHFVVVSPEGKVLGQWEGYRSGTLKKKVKDCIGG